MRPHEAQWKRIKALVADALETHGRQRDEFLSRNCSDDEELRHEVNKLLASFEEAGSFLLEDPNVFPNELREDSNP